jgi:hypothetical protein
MEAYSLFGIPYPLIGFVCFLLAGAFYFIWPKSRAKELNTLNFPKFVLHYFHPMGWVLIGMAAFMQARFANLAAILAGVGVLAFFMFLYVLIRR